MRFHRIFVRTSCVAGPVRARSVRCTTPIQTVARRSRNSRNEFHAWLQTCERHAEKQGDSRAERSLRGPRHETITLPGPDRSGAVCARALRSRSMSVRRRARRHRDSARARRRREARRPRSSARLGKVIPPATPASPSDAEEKAMKVSGPPPHRIIHVNKNGGTFSGGSGQLRRNRSGSHRRQTRSCPRTEG